MALRQVEGLEVVPVGFDLRTFLDGVADAGEDHLQLVSHLAQNMDVPTWQRSCREGDIHGLGLRDVGELRRLLLGTPGLQGRLHSSARLVGLLSQGGALLRRQRGNSRQELAADLSLAPAEVFDLDGLEVGLGGGARNGSEGLFAQAPRLAHVALLRAISNMITAAAAATFSDSTPELTGMVTSSRSARDRPCASLPKTIMPADSIGASASGAPPEDAAP